MKSRTILTGLLWVALIPASTCLYAQDTTAVQETHRKDAIKFYMDCGYCDLDYIRREIPYVNFVRDVKEAQLYVLMTSQVAGNGGEEYTFSFEGQRDFSGMNDTLRFVTRPDDTDDLIRRRQLKTLKMGLMRYVAHTPLAREISISHSEELGEEEVTDRWNNWLFELRFSPFMEGEETYKELSLFNSLRVTRVTEDWKLDFDFDHHYERIAYTYEDTSYAAFRNSEDLENLVVKSLNEHWSVGGEVNFRSSSFSNLKFQAEVIPALEFNFFPYSESTRRQLRLMYGVGFSSNYYNDSTIYGKIRDDLFLHGLRAAYEVKQKWGSVDVSLEAMNFLHDFSKNRIELGGSVEVRIVKGLSLEVFGEIARVRDQLSLSASELSEADVLLRLQEIATGYYYFCGIGVSYTFGSIYNNVVNPRFGHY